MELKRLKEITFSCMEEKMTDSTSIKILLRISTSRSSINERAFSLS